MVPELLQKIYENMNYFSLIITSIKIWTLAFDCKVALVIVIKSFPSLTIKKVC